LSDEVFQDWSIGLVNIRLSVFVKHIQNETITDCSANPLGWADIPMPYGGRANGNIQGNHGDDKLPGEYSNP
jgi:hypothetical protein